MITCTLGDKKYSVTTVTGRALREIGPASDVYLKLSKIGQDAQNGINVDDADVDLGKSLDVMVQWFCILFQNQFTPDEFYDNYPADQIVTDLALAIIAVQNAASHVLDSFPTTPAVAAALKGKKTPKKTTA